jgi:hypothetical protein
LGRLFSFFLLLLFVGGPAHAEVSPRLETEQERLQFLLWAQKEAPGIFEQAAIFQVNLREFVVSQQKAQALLAAIQEYQREAAARTHYTTLEITPKPGPIAREEIPRAVIDKKMEELDGQLLGLGEPEESFSNALTKEIQRASSQLRGVGTKRLIAGLIEMLPPEKREAMRAHASESSEALLKYLERELPTTLPNSFRTDRHRLGTNDRAETIAHVREQMKVETELRHWIELHAFFQDERGNLPPTLGDAIDRLDGLKPQDFDRLTRPANAYPRFKRAVDQTQALANLSPGVEGRYLGEMVADMRTEMPLGPIPPSSAGGRKLTVREVPPALATLFGFIGGDCGSQKCLGVQNAPLERTFFIYDSKNMPLGYLSSSIVEENGHRKLMIKAPGGAHLSEGEAEMVIDAVAKSHAAYGVEGVMLAKDSPGEQRRGAPPGYIFDGLISIPAHRELMRRLGQGKPEVPISFPDAQIRKTLDEAKLPYATHTGDAVKYHPTAIPYTPSTRDDFETKVIKHEAPRYEFDPVTPEQALMFALDLHFSRQPTDASHVLAMSHITEEQFKQLVAVLENTRRLPLEEYKAAVAKTLARKNLDPNLLAAKPYLGAIGTLRAPDSLSPTHAREGAAAFLSLIRSADERDVASNEVASRSAVLSTNRDVQKVLLKLLRGAGGGSLIRRINPDAVDEPVLAALTILKKSRMPLNDELRTELSRIVVQDHGQTRYQAFSVLYRDWGDRPPSAEILKLAEKVLDQSRKQETYDGVRNFRPELHRECFDIIDRALKLSPAPKLNEKTRYWIVDEWRYNTPDPKALVPRPYSDYVAARDRVQAMIGSQKLNPNDWVGIAQVAVENKDGEFTGTVLINNLLSNPKRDAELREILQRAGLDVPPSRITADYIVNHSAALLDYYEDCESAATHLNDAA